MRKDSSKLMIAELFKIILAYLSGEWLTVLYLTGFLGLKLKLKSEFMLQFSASQHNLAQVSIANTST